MKTRQRFLVSFGIWSRICSGGVAFWVPGVWASGGHVAACPGCKVRVLKALLGPRSSTLEHVHSPIYVCIYYWVVEVLVLSLVQCAAGPPKGGGQLKWRNTHRHVCDKAGRHQQVGLGV